MAHNTTKQLHSLLSAEKGATMVEYLLILAAILMVTIPSVSAASVCVADKFLQIGYVIGGSEGTPPFAC